MFQILMSEIHCSGCGCGCGPIKGKDYFVSEDNLIWCRRCSWEYLDSLEVRVKELEDGIRKHKESRALNGYVNSKDAELWKLIELIPEIGL